MNNENTKHPCNVFYHEVNLPNNFPMDLLKYVPNVNYECIATDGLRELRLVALIANRDIAAGEELFSSYITVVRNR